MRRRIMKVFLMIVFSFLITAGTASAENSLKSGAKALSFGISDIKNVAGSGTDATQIGTFSSGVTVNFYLP